MYIYREKKKAFEINFSVLKTFTELKDNINRTSTNEIKTH